MHKYSYIDKYVNTFYIYIYIHTGRISPSKLLVIIPSHFMGCTFGTVLFKCICPIAPHLVNNKYMYIYICIYVDIHGYIHIHIYTYIYICTIYILYFMGCTFQTVLFRCICPIAPHLVSIYICLYKFIYTILFI
jgi:hypothetical protein